MTLAAAAIVNPDYVPTDYQTFLLTTLIMIIHGFISSMPTRWIANFNSVGSTFNIIALFIVIIIIPAATNREEQGLPKFSAASDVWGTIYAGTDWPNGIAILMSFVSVIWVSPIGEVKFDFGDGSCKAHLLATILLF
jgi:amino acid transporter